MATPLIRSTDLLFLEPILSAVRVDWHVSGIYALKSSVKSLLE